MNLSNLTALAAKHTDVRNVEFRERETGLIVHGTEGDLLYSVDLVYIGQAKAAVITKAAVRRKVTNASKAQKEDVSDSVIATVALCKEVVRGWGLTVAACRKLRAPLDYSKMTNPDELVPFNPANLAFMAEQSDFGVLTLQCLGDFEFWHPEQAAQLGNSGTGPGGSTPGSMAAAAPASPVT